MSVRLARPADADRVAAIHNEGIAGGRATFDRTMRTAEQTAAWIRATEAPHTVLVAVVGEDVVGWAATFPYSHREAYATVAEFSVYVAAAAAGQGHGLRLLRRLVEVSEAGGLHKLVGRVLAANTGSLRLCARTGFRQVGVHQRHGRIGGVWSDVVVVERLMGEAAQGLPD